MHPHHARTIQNVKEHFEAQPEVLALLLSGSIAHGFENEESDVDILIIVSDEDYQQRRKTGQTTFLNFALASYPEGILGFVDGKFLSLEFIRQVAQKGSEPARFAFDGVKILFSKIEIENELQQATAYPLAEKQKRMTSFRGQLEAWKWFCGEARKKKNDYLLGVAVSKLILFGGRLILAHNEMLYPYHKWFLRVLKDAPDKPDNLLACIDKLTAEHSAENVAAFYELVKGFKEWPANPYGQNWDRWGAQFMRDTELTWVDDKTPVDDL